MHRPSHGVDESPVWMAAERAFCEAGYSTVAGVDEVGRGALAGPLIAAAIVFPKNLFRETMPCNSAIVEVRDSKLLRPTVRRRLATEIMKVADGVGIGMVAADEIDEIGISAANRMAMERAVMALPFEPSCLVLDAVVTDLGMPQVGIIDGDACCFSIAAASIVAKVTRDEYMAACHVVDARYDFQAHKGYGTPDHLAALSRFGPCRLHRRTFAPVAWAFARRTS